MTRPDAAAMDGEGGRLLTCPQCGEDTPEFVEGFCPECQADRQFRLDEHNARLDWWAKLSDRERDHQIRSAM